MEHKHDHTRRVIIRIVAVTSTASKHESISWIRATGHSGTTNCRHIRDRSGGSQMRPLSGRALLANLVIKVLCSLCHITSQSFSDASFSESHVFSSTSPAYQARTLSHYIASCRRACVAPAAWCYEHWRQVAGIWNVLNG